MTKPADSVACKLYGKGLTFSRSKDTAETVNGIERKNQTFKNYGCRL